MFCRKCGQENNPKAKFCTGCGEEINTKIEQPVDSSQAEISKKIERESKVGHGTGFKINKKVLVSVVIFVLIVMTIFIGIQWQQKDRGGLVGKKDTTRKVVKDKAPTIFKFRDEKLFGLVNEELQIVKEPFAEYISEMSKSGISVFTIDYDNNEMGLIDKKGEIIELNEVTSVGQYPGSCFSQEIFSPNGVTIFMYDASNYGEDSSMGLINKEGEIVKEPFASLILPYSTNGYANFVSNDKTGIVDEAGEIVIEPIYDQIITLPKDRFIVRKTSEVEKYNIIDASGEEIRENISYSQPVIFDDGIIFTNAAGKQGIMNLELKIIKEPFANYISPFSEASDVTFYQKENDGKCGLINREGKIVLEPTFESISMFNDKKVASARMEQDEESVLINTAGKVIVEQVGYSAYPEVGTNLFISTEQKSDKGEGYNDVSYQLIDSEGEKIEGNFDSIQPSQRMPTSFIVVNVMDDEERESMTEDNFLYRFGVVSKDGRVLSEDAIYVEEKGNLILIQESDDTLIIFNTSGKEIKRKNK